MRGRRHKLQVSTFPFLAVLLCAMGSLILILLVMDRKAHQAAVARAQREAAKLVEQAAQTEAARREEIEQKREEARAAHEQKREAQHTKLSREQIELQLQMRQVRDQLGEIAARLRYEQDTSTELRHKVQDERSRLEAEKRLLATLRGSADQATAQSQESSQALRRMTLDLLQMEQVLKDLRAARQREQHTFSVVPYHGRRGESRRPIYVECTGEGVVFHPEKRAMSVTSREFLVGHDHPGGEPDDVRREVERRIAQLRAKLAGKPEAKATPYLLLLVRPDGVATYGMFQAVLKDMTLDFGYEFIDADWVLDFPTDDDATGAQPWMAAAKPAPASAPVSPSVPSSVRPTRPVGLEPSYEGGGMVPGPRGVRTAEGNGRNGWLRGAPPMVGSGDPLAARGSMSGGKNPAYPGGGTFLGAGQGVVTPRAGGSGSTGGSPSGVPGQPNGSGAYAAGSGPGGGGSGTVGVAAGMGRGEGRGHPSALAPWQKAGSGGMGGSGEGGGAGDGSGPPSAYVVGGTGRGPPGSPAIASAGSSGGSAPALGMPHALPGGTTAGGGGYSGGDGSGTPGGSVAGGNGSGTGAGSGISGSGGSGSADGGVGGAPGDGASSGVALGPRGEGTSGAGGTGTPGGSLVGGTGMGMTGGSGFSGARGSGSVGNGVPGPGGSGVSSGTALGSGGDGVPGGGGLGMGSPGSGGVSGAGVARSPGDYLSGANVSMPAGGSVGSGVGGTPGVGGVPQVSGSATPGNGTMGNGGSGGGPSGSPTVPGGSVGGGYAIARSDGGNPIGQPIRSSGGGGGSTTGVPGASPGSPGSSVAGGTGPSVPGQGTFSQSGGSGPGGASNGATGVPAGTANGGRPAASGGVEAYAAINPLAPRQPHGIRPTERDPDDSPPDGPTENAPPGAPRRKVLVQGGGSGGGSGGPVDPAAAAMNRFAPPTAEAPKQRKPAALRPAWVHGGRDWTIYVECLPDGVKLYPAERMFSRDQAAMKGSDNPLLAALRQMIDRRQMGRRPGEPPYHPQVCLLVRPENVGTFLSVYPALESLPVPKTRRNLDPDDDVAAIVVGANP